MSVDRVLATERRERLLRLLDDEGRVVASEVAGRLEVSLDTVRRDLDELASAGALRRVHGGALPPSPGPRRFVDRVEREAGAKQAIARAAVSLITPGQVLLLGGGTAVLQLARQMPDDLHATALTTAPDVAAALLDHSALDVVMLGGSVDPQTRTVVGAETVAAVRTLRADLCVLGGCSLDADAGLTVVHREEAIVERVMIERSGRLAVLTDATKLGTTGPYIVGEASDVDVLVTDSGARRSMLTQLGRRGVEVVRA
jgi:DeoR/GlpR family transcriptional regulator of sugar metabolism